MIEYYSRTGLVKIKKVLFSEKVYPADFYKLVSYNYTRAKSANPLFIRINQNTVIIDLLQDEDLIFRNFSKKNKYEIRMASTVNIKFELVEDLHEFINFYNSFAIKKNLILLEHRTLLKVPNLIITKAVHDNESLVMHSYIIDHDLSVARLLHSASIRLEENANKKIVGWANRYLHFEDIKHFKSNHIKNYDFGGLFEYTKKNRLILGNVARFKKGFGGKIIDEYFYETIPHFIAIQTKKLITKVL